MRCSGITTVNIELRLIQCLANCLLRTNQVFINFFRVRILIILAAANNLANFFFILGVHKHIFLNYPTFGIKC